MTFTVNEIFESIQGEGIHTGFPTLFIRFSGCNLRCSWCDTPYALNSENGEERTFEFLIEKIAVSRMKYICFTGGEPLLQHDISILASEALEKGKKVDIETNGSVDISRLIEHAPQIMVSMDVKPPSSNEVESFHLGNLEHLRTSDQMKFIISDRKDLDHAFEFIRKNRPVSNMIFTPCSFGDGAFIAEAILEAMKDEELDSIIGDSRLMIQTHKVIWDPESRGV